MLLLEAETTMATALRAPLSPNQLYRHLGGSPLATPSQATAWPPRASQPHLPPKHGFHCSQAASPLRFDQQGDLLQLPISADQLGVIAVLIDRHLGND